MFRIPILGSSSGTWIVNYTNYKSIIMVRFKTKNLKCKMSQPSTRRHTTSDAQYYPSLLHVDTQLLMHSGPTKQLRYSTF
jgi:hypothetical protein